MKEMIQSEISFDYRKLWGNWKEGEGFVPAENYFEAEERLDLNQGIHLGTKEEFYKSKKNN